MQHKNISSQKKYESFKTQTCETTTFYVSPDSRESEIGIILDISDYV